MSVLIFIDHADGHIKKSSHEAISYGTKLATQLNTTAEGILLGTVQDDLAALGKYGVTKIHQVANEQLNNLDAQIYTQVLAEAIQTIKADICIFSHNALGKAVAPRLSAKLKAGLVAGAVALPDTSNGFVVKKSVFSGKAFAYVKINTAIKIISLNPIAFHVTEVGGTATIEALSIAVPSSNIKLIKKDKVTGEGPL